MSGIRAEIEQLQRDAEEATRAAAAAGTKATAAQTREEDLRAELRREFGVGTVDEAQAKAEKWEAGLRDEASRVRQLLAQAGGEGT
jgi:hypothetical protein